MCLQTHYSHITTHHSHHHLNHSFIYHHQSSSYIFSISIWTSSSEQISPLTRLYPISHNRFVYTSFDIYLLFFIIVAHSSWSLSPFNSSSSTSSSCATVSTVMTLDHYTFFGNKRQHNTIINWSMLKSYFLFIIHWNRVRNISRLSIHIFII